MHHPTKHIQGLITRFLTRKATDADIHELQAWLEEDPEHVSYFNEANEKFQATATLSQFDLKKVNDAWQHLTARIETLDTRQAPDVVRFNFLRIAASVSIVLLSLFAIWKIVVKKKFSGTGDNIVFHSGEKNVHLLLPDSTSVWLNTNSTIEYTAKFSEKREVKLKGEAFFDVRKKQEQNFVVRTENFSIQVKGTRFNVQAYETQDENATLEEGEIELTVKGEQQAYAMAPGDQITIKKAQQKVVFKKVDPTDFSAWKEDKLVFDNALLEDIILKLENRYHIDIVIEDAIAQRERLTMTIEQEPIEEILEMIQLSSRLNYRKENEQIIIYE
jgi:transmembrane sensor